MESKSEHPRRRYWETTFMIKVSTWLSIFLLAGASWFLYGRIKLLEKPYNPHYKIDNCFDCHEAKGSKMTAQECFGCHDPLTREKLPEAAVKRAALTPMPCNHPIRVYDKSTGKTVTQLCLSCHQAVNGYVAMTNIADGTYVEIDISRTHPIGLESTDLIYPRTLPLSKQTKAINCTTCHDPHGADKRMRLLRYYYPGNGRPADFRPLCNDCHTNEWLPLKIRRNDVVRKATRPKVGAPNEH